MLRVDIRRVGMVPRREAPTTSEVLPVASVAHRVAATELRPVVVASVDRPVVVASVDRPVVASGLHPVVAASGLRLVVGMVRHLREVLVFRWVAVDVSCSEVRGGRSL
jgi:hypothetical protein